MLFTFANVERLMDDDEAAYANRKRRGGTSALLGSRFEDVVAICNVLDAMAAWAKPGRHAAEGYVVEQVQGYVDDLVVKYPDDGRVVYIQAKSGGVAWSSGDRPVVRDFQLQVRLCRELETPYKLQLAVPEGRRPALHVPAELADRFVIVEYPLPPVYETVPRSATRHARLMMLSSRRMGATRATTMNQLVAVKAAWDMLDGRAALPSLLNRVAQIDSGAFVSLEWRLQPTSSELELLWSVPDVEPEIIGGTVTFTSQWDNRLAIDFHNQEDWDGFIDHLRDASPADFLELTLVTEAYE